MRGESGEEKGIEREREGRRDKIGTKCLIDGEEESQRRRGGETGDEAWDGGGRERSGCHRKRKNRKERKK